MWNPFSDATEGAVKGFGSAIKDAVSAFKADPTKLVELEANIEQAAMQFEAQTIQAVNETMRAEAASEHWMQWSWRPTVGFTFCAVLINNYILLPYLKNYGMQVIVIPETVWSAILVVLGAAAATRGWAQVEKARKSD